MFETDIYIDNRYNYTDENFNILVNTHFLIECKSTANPPINYLFIPKKGLNKDSKIKFIFPLKGSKFLSDISLELDSICWTDHDIIQIKYPILDIDEKNAFNEAFWQFFRRIDYENNRIDFTTFNFNISEILKKKIPDDFGMPNYISLFKDYYRRMEENNIINEILKDKIDLNISIYVPIIVFNGNIIP